MHVRHTAPLVRGCIGILCAFALGCRIFPWPPLPRDAVRFAPPPVYARWWTMTEACSGITRPLASVEFYRVHGAKTIWVPFKGDAGGYYAPSHNRIVLAGEYADDGATVRHEMLHALLQMPGHPRAQFLGRCGGVVYCDTACVADAGPRPAPSPAAVPVRPEALEVSAEVIPAVPSLAVDSGLFMVVFRIHNPATHAVVVVPPPPPDPRFAAQPVRFHYGITQAGSGGLSPDAMAGPPDPSGYVFAAGETRERVYDLALDAKATGWFTRRPDSGHDPVLGPGRYVFRGYYGNIYDLHWSDSVTVSFAP